VAHDPKLDPRVEWVISGLVEEYDVCEIGNCPDGLASTGPILERLSEARIRIQISRNRHGWHWLNQPAAAAGRIGVASLTRLCVLGELPAQALAEVIGGKGASDHDIAHFRSYCRYFVQTNAGFIQAARLLGKFDLVVAADLDTLPAAVALGEEQGCLVVYDAHEYWAHANPWPDWLSRFWDDFTKDLVRGADLCAVVCPQLAELMSRAYGKSFVSMPNAAPRRAGDGIDIESALRELSTRDRIKFLYQGGFSPDRGIDHVIESWRHVDERAQLWLRGPDNSTKSELMELTNSLGLLGKTVFFAQAVAPDALIAAARECDVGLIPYMPFVKNYQYACPNKLSEYLAAGLPVICNELDFVKTVVVGNNLGASVDFSDHEAVRQLINRFVNAKHEIVAMSCRSRSYFDNSFNWEIVSQSFYGALSGLMRDRPQISSPLDLSSIGDAREMNMENAEYGTSVSLFFETGNENYYSEEMARLNQVIKEQSKSYMEEINRLNRVYPDELDKLRQALTSLHQEYAFLRRNFFVRAYLFAVRRLGSLLKAFKR
jgi:glycosyltransferase involved in cell wall biosynthesis